MSEMTMEDEGRKPFGMITRFLVFCAGADERLLRACPNSDLVKIQGIGGVVAATGLLAFLSGSYAFYTVFSPKESLIGGAAMASATGSGFAAVGALVFGLIWALVIFNLDRFIVAASGPGDGKDTISGSEFRTALPRIVMAVLIGLVLAAPLEVRIMKTEIEAALSMAQSKKQAELNALTDARLKDDRQRLDAELSRVRAEVSDREQKVTELQEQLRKFTEDLNRELQDGGTGRVRGDGPVAAALRSNMREVETRLAAEREAVQPQIQGLQREAADIQRRIDALQQKRDDEYAINTKNAQRDDGLMRRITLAHEVSPVASYLLKFLLIVIEVAPIIFKLMLIAGPYEYFTENEKRLAIARRAIDVAGAVRPGAAGKPGELLEVKAARYAQAEAITAREVGKFRVEANLTNAALEAHQKRLEADIGAHPERYVDPPPPASQA
jgi:uncharacterized protein YoxC